MSKGYSVTMRHESYKHGAASGIVRHSIRSVEEEHGTFRNHSNEKIVAGRTRENMVVVNDGQGGFKEPDSPDEVHAYRKSMIAQRADKRKLRSNQLTHMETIVQLDGDFAGTAVEFLNDSRGTRDEATFLLDVLTEHVVEKVGQKNVNYIALHLDETSPHVHIGWTPLAENGSLDYRAVIGEMRTWKDGRTRGTLTPKMMSDQHKEVRELMNKHGYPAVEVFSSKDHEKHEVYKRQQEQLDAAFSERESKVTQREDDCEEREVKVKQREDDHEEAKKQFATERDDFAKEMDKQRQELDTQRQQHQEAVRKQKEELENERATKLNDVESREKSVREWEERQVKTRKAVAKFMQSRYYRNAVEHPMEVSREQAAFVKEVGDLYADIRPTGLEPTRSTPSDRARSRSEATTSRAKPRTPTKHAQRRKPDIVREIEEARAKKRKGQPQGGGKGGGKPSGGDSPDF